MPGTGAAAHLTAWSNLPDEAAIVDAVGPETFRRGEAYARDGRVTWLSNDARTGVLYASVEGSRQRPYQTLVTVGAGPLSGRCTCPVAVNCKHMAAVLVAALEDLTGRGRAAAAGRTPGVPEWEQVLADVVRSPIGTPDQSGVPIGLQVELMDLGPGAPRLRLRPVRPGKRDNWVRTGITWRDLQYSYIGGNHVRAHREALQDLYRAHQSRGYYHYADEPVYLDEFGPTLWHLLRRVVDTGVPLVTAKGTPGPVALADEPAEIVLDLARTATADLAVTPAVQLAGRHGAGRTLATVGNPPHGLVLATTGPSGTPTGLLLTPLARALTPKAAALVTAGSLTVPAADVDRFLREYYPGLRQVIAVRSRDESVELPEIAPPRLTVRATPTAGHRLTVTWAFRYEVDGQARLVPLRGPAAPGRDLAAERRLLADLALPTDVVPQLRELDRGQLLLVPEVELRGVDAAIFVEDVVPGLREQGVVVDLDDAVPDYRLSEAAPVIRLSATDSEDRDWFDLGVQVELDGEEVPFQDLFTALARGESHLVLRSGTYFSLERPELDQLRRLIEEARNLQDRASKGLRISTYQAGLWEELAQLGVVAAQSARWSATVTRLLAGEEAEPPAVPAGLAAELRPYQLEGYRWLAYLWDSGLGGILADDMGLGKTLQTLATICRAREAGTLTAPVLVVAPTSVVGNWAVEAARFAPDLRVATVTETQKKSGRPLVDDVAGADVVLTSYALFRLDNPGYAALPWAGLVLDEAQFVKNHQAKIYQCARKLTAPFKLAITGTPLENSLMDLWSLLSIVAPGMFPDPTAFTETYRKPIESGADPARLATLRRRIRPFIRRRTKEQVASDLPPKQEQVLRVTLNPRHHKIYQTHLQRERRKILDLVDDLDKNRFTILRSLTLLRQLSLDPALVDEKYAGVRSSKADAFLEQLQEVVDGGHRALVFSQFTGFLGTVRARLEEEGIEYVYLDGRTRDRPARIAEFKTGPAPVFLISLKAGGFGLNLTEADYCFILDPWWNPAAEAQAVDRTHRIGQDKHVMVYKLVAEDTIEEKVLELQARKQDLFDRVIDDGGELAAPLSAEEIRNLLAS
ncbi:DEAD/DEAH box helicase [Georgenia yuyongxinii]|uniref:DEAD/DEAH box helicase n=1 Tax=Georgenia yuyongxinii TaxID=2589797 RepID=UPI001C8F268A|nr:DEAD/DEAH box helicase [Georgenia yuyongxinii]